MMSSPEMKSYMTSQVQENIMRSIREDLSKNIPMKNPNRRVEELLQDQIDQHNATEQELMKKLSGITYENIKLNAQVEVLNKTVDSQREELDNLKGINRELEKTNKMMEDKKKSDDKYWPRTAVLSIGCVVLGYILNLLTPELEKGLISVLKLFQSFLQSMLG